MEPLSPVIWAMNVVLDPGAVAEHPVKDKMKMVIFLAIPILSVLLVLAIVLRREFHGLLVGTPTEVAFWGNGPVLAATAWPTDSGGLDELVAGLDDLVPNATGSLLIVGASPNESLAAEELAHRLHSDWFLTGAAASPPVHDEPRPAERGPLQTPPPTGPYPIGGSRSSSVALAVVPSAPSRDAIRLADRADLRIEAWDGPQEGQSLRRAARIADRVVVLVHSGATSVLQLHGVQTRVGRQHGIGYIVVGLGDEFRELPDRVGDAAGFWRS